jgi:hypothetical protein
MVLRESSLLVELIELSSVKKVRLLSHYIVLIV